MLIQEKFYLSTTGVKPSSPYPQPFDRGIPPQTASQIDHRVQRLARAFGLREYDIDEIRSMFVLAVYKGLADYDVTKSSPLTFAKQILHKAFLRIALKLRGECRRRRRCKPQKDSLELAFAVENGADAVDGREVLEVLRRRSKKHSDLLFDLGHMTPAQAARHNEVHRGTVSRQVAAIRRSNGDLQKYLNSRATNSL